MLLKLSVFFFLFLTYFSSISQYDKKLNFENKFIFQNKGANFLQQQKSLREQAKQSNSSININAKFQAKIGVYLVAAQARDKKEWEFSNYRLKDFIRVGVQNG